MAYIALSLDILKERRYKKQMAADHIIAKVRSTGEKLSAAFLLAILKKTALSIDPVKNIIPIGFVSVL